jgi:putative Ca2+/H+ antiporter (TMEM165/GDT1 family)
MAEMGDKTQILAMAFATQYGVRHILSGVAIGSFFNHGLAILLGTLISRFLPMPVIEIVAGLLFLFFAFTSLSVEDADEEPTPAKFGPVVTVALAFFLGELGDKTQLAAMSLGASSLFPFFVLLGTVTGMVLTSGMGIVVGRKLGDKIPEFAMKTGAFVVFLFFGLEKILGSSVIDALPTVPVYGVVVLLVVAGVFMVRRFKGEIAQRDTVLKKRARALTEMLKTVEEQANQLCLGCTVCDGSACLVGYIKGILSWHLKEGKTIDFIDESRINRLDNKGFSPETAKHTLELLLAYYREHPVEYKTNESLHHLRHSLEMMIFQDRLEAPDLEAYETLLKERLEAL